MLGATLMITQSFLYNAIFFTYALVLTKIYDVPAKDTAYYFIFFALGNLIGPLTHRAPVRHHRPAPDDRRHLSSLRNPPGRSAPCSSTPGCSTP